MAFRPAGTPAQLLGRGKECAYLDDLVVAIRQGRSRTVVLRGEAGVGKTALLEYLVTRAPDLMLVRGVGVESEMELPYASLHQLCAPLIDRLARLPDPQREALEIVFGLAVGPAPSRFLVGLAVLSLLSEVAEERPLLCLVDDAQWLDHASAQTLAFVARRLLAEPVGLVLAAREPVGLVFAAREPAEDLRGLPDLAVTGLDDGDARALLGLQVRFLLDERVRDRLVAETRGNPLALLELPRGLTGPQLAGGFGLLAAESLPGRIEESFLRRLETLSDETRLLLLVAAAEPLGDPLLVWSAADHLGLAVSMITGAETDGLLAIGEHVTFRHPLVRSAVYGSAPVDQRRAVHLALAEATNRDLDPDRRAWHLAAAAAGPDEDVATELEQSAERAQTRGGLAAAAAFLQRSVELTRDPEQRTKRALAAAGASLQAGALDTAVGLLGVAEAGPLDELQRARADLLRAEVAYSQSRGSDAPALLLRAAKALEPLDPKVARETYLDAWSAALFAGRLAGEVDLHEVSRQARAAPRPADALRPSDLLLDGFSRLFTDGRTAAAPVLERAATGFAGSTVSIEEVLRWGWLATAAAVVVWDYDTCLAVSTRGVQVARDSGALTVLAVSVNVMTQAVVLGGDFPNARVLMAEADAVTEATGTLVAPYGALVLAGFKGDGAEGSKLIEKTIREATAGGQGTAVQYAHWANSVLLNGAGRYREALAAARHASEDTPELFVSDWARSELIEAAIRSGEPEVARTALEELVEHVRARTSAWGLGLEARARALLSDGDRAERSYQEAIGRLGQTRLRPELARAHLLYGEWLRRENRRVDARAELHKAHDLFSSIGMEAFAGRARTELSATGEKVRKRSVETRDELTPQERQIAQLARDGLSNPEIGARLFLSPRTVEWHLRKVFTKLGITSRKELAGVLPASESELVTV